MNAPAVECNLCGWIGAEFEPRFRNSGRNCVCGQCRSLDRNRHLYHVLRHDLEIGAETAVLDIAPTAQIQKLLSGLCRYVAIDIQGYTREIIPMDVTRLEFPDNYFHLVMCSHVFEHIRDDQKAYSEIHRVLMPGGRLVSQVPYKTSGSPVELETPDKHGHVRILTRNDYLDRLAGVRFETRGVNYASALTRYGFDREDVFISTKMDQETVVRKYDYQLLTWIQHRVAESNKRAKDFARKPIAT